MKKTIISMMMAGTMLCLTSCVTSESSLNDLRTLSTQINTEGNTYGVAQWQKVGKKFYKTDKRIAYFTSKNAYTDAQLKEIGSLQRQCAEGFVQGAGENIMGKITSITEFLDGLLDK